MVWLEQNFVLVLSAAFALSALCLTLGALAAWRAAKRLERRSWPIFRFALSLVLALAGAGGVALFLDGLVTVVPASRAQHRMVGEPAPELAFSYVEREGEGRLADFRGRVVLVNIWATWCPPCRHEMPELDRLQADYSAEGLVVLHISDEDLDTVFRYLAERPMSTVHGVARPIPWPEFGRPTTFVVDRLGVVRETVTGPRDYEGFERLIRGYL